MGDKIDYTGAPEIGPKLNIGGGYNINASPQAFGSDMFAAIHGLGQVGEEAAGRKQALVNDLDHNNRALDVSDATSKEWESMGNKEGHAAVSYLPTFKNNLRKIYDDAIKNAPNDEVRKQLAQSAFRDIDRQMMHGTNYAETQLRKWHEETHERAIKTTINQAELNRNQPDNDIHHMISNGVNGVGGANSVRERMLSKGWNYDTPEGKSAIDSAVEDYNGQAYASIVKALVDDGDVRRADRIFQQARSSMDAKSQNAIDSFLKPKREAIDAQGIADHALRRAPATNLTRTYAPVVADELSKAGASSSAVRGIMANISHESGFNPMSRSPDQPRFSGEAHYAHGFVQMGGEEWNKYDAWLKSEHPGSDWRDPKRQVQFLAHNLKTNYPNTWKKMNAATPEAAAQIFLHEYERPRADLAASRHEKYSRGVPDISEYGGSIGANQTDQDRGPQAPVSQQPQLPSAPGTQGEADLAGNRPTPSARDAMYAREAANIGKTYDTSARDAYASLPDKGAVMANAVEEARRRWPDNPNMQNAVLAKVREAYSIKQADAADEARAEKEHKEALHQDMLKAEDEYIRDALGGNPKRSAKDILADPRLAVDPSKREHLIKLYAGDGDGVDKDASAKRTRELSRLMADESDPHHISDLGGINAAYYGGQITRTDWDRLTKEFKENRTDDGNSFLKMKNKFYEAAKTQIIKPVMGMPYPPSSIQFFEYTRAIDAKIDRLRKSGESPDNIEKLFTSAPGGFADPEFMKQYQAETKQVIDYQSSQLRRGTAPKLTPEKSKEMWEILHGSR